MTTVFKYIDISGPTYECECCGSYSATGIDVMINDALAWRTYSDGHLHGMRTEESLVDAVLAAWSEQTVRAIDAQYTETARAEWNKKHPGNTVAATPENWAREKAYALRHHTESLHNIKESCATLPYRELLQLKMIALWVENASGEKIRVVENRRYEKE